MADALFEGFDPLPTQRVSLCTILRYPYLVTDLKIFLKVLSAPIYTDFERGARAKKTRFFGQNCPKKPKNAFWPVFIKNSFVTQKICPLVKLVFLELWQSSEFCFARPKKKSTKFSQCSTKKRSA